MRRNTPNDAHSAGLEGLRGLCLVAVLCFHAPFEWMSGGFLGVSTFFTLSGYLITRILLVEWCETGRIDYRKFWYRRLRRLTPALWLAIAATLASGDLWLSESSRERLAGDALSSLFFVANQRFMSPDYAYSMIFDNPSVFQHCWSLAIEAQYYLVFPLLISVVMWRSSARNRLRTFFAGFGSVVGVSDRCFCGVVLGHGSR